MLPFLSEQRHKTLTALNSDFVFLAVFGEHSMIKHNSVCVCVCVCVEKQNFYCRNAITGQEVRNSQPLLETGGSTADRGKVKPCEITSVGQDLKADAQVTEKSTLFFI